ncbi:CRISPR-associated protein Cas5 [uncultured Methanobrevibacter sp.]|uniref:CRISPR-associated protein Cas5 n=1 Tax=uncultured Methanobrevibacter sp. TaxID=253161 RepID=UPI00261A8F72|nr:CRISPR-associated protein Cas5 [uncultured Methanobrevibacter sp.]
MEALRFDLEIPFWCSFGDYSSLNIKLSYPCPSLTTLFGLIQNALGFEALHNIPNKSLQNKLKKQYTEYFNNLKFSIIICNSGELIEDYVNIHKGSREKDKLEDALKKKLDGLITNHPNEEDIKEIMKYIKKYSFYNFLLDDDNQEYNEIYYKVVNYEESLINVIIGYWEGFSNPNNLYDINKIWLSTQINRQRLIEPKYSIYILSDDEGEFSLNNIKNALENPKRPLYLGESDDVVNILNISLVNIEKTNSARISSIIPGLYSNSDLIKLPTNLKFNTQKEIYTLCSVPKGELDTIIECYEYDGERFVFL